MKNTQTRHLVLILGDQLDEDSSAFDGFDPAQDRVLMVEAFEESTHVWSHKIRTTLFLSAMRHFAEILKKRGWQVDYRALDSHGDKTLADGLLAAIEQHQPQAVIGVEPGDLRVRDQIEVAMKSGAACARIHSSKPLKDAKKELLPLEQGAIAIGEITDIRQDFSVKINNKSPYIIEFVFEAGGQKHVGDVGNIFDRASTMKEIGDQLWIVYMPEDPSLSSIWPPIS